MYILGITLSHDRSACLLKDGRIVVTIAEERLDGVKKSTLYALVRKKDQSVRVPPLRAIAYCLEAEGIGIDDLDFIVADHAIEPVNVESLKAILPVRDKSKIRSIPHPSHHLAHAYSAYFCSPFAESAVLVADVFGSETENGTEAESGFYAEGNRIRPVLKNFQRQWSEKNHDVRIYYGLTYIYNFISLALGFAMEGENTFHGEIISEAGKTMGLASYGRLVEDWPPIIEFHNNRLESTRFTQWALDHKIAKMRKGTLVPIARSKNARLTQTHMNLAYVAQAEIEKGMIFLANRLQAVTGSVNLCIAGGIGLNSIVNKKILDETAFENIFIQPASTDDGTAIGCALYGWHALAGQDSRFPLKHIYLGNSYSAKAVRTSLRKHKLTERTMMKNELLRQTAQHLANGKIVGWYQGGSEFGPRALGHRSILADPRRAKMKNLVNQKVKHRESFRPYAPSVLLEHAADYFDLACPSPYMLLVAKALENKTNEIPAVVHVDGTARVQTVTKADNDLFYELIKEFHRLTGMPVLLNTSFNVKGMPIVETPDDAIEVFFDSEMDVLVLGHHLFAKDDQDTLAGLIFYLEENRKFNEAMQATQYARQKYPDDGRFYLHEAILYYENKKYPESIRAAEKALRLNARADGIRMHFILGMSYEKMGEYSKAVHELKEAEKVESDSHRINIALVRCYQKMNQIELMNQELDKGYEKLSNKIRGF